MATSPRVSPDEQTSLVADLNLTTRKEQATLGEIIQARLPLALPPHTDNAFLYAAGITVFANVYVAVEEVWRAMLRQESTGFRYSKMFMQLYTSNLFRSGKLALDMRSLQAKLDADQTTVLESLKKQSLKYQDAVVERIREKPHRLFAYAWAMYLALLDEREQIVQQFRSAGPDFWGVASLDNINCLSMWTFEPTEEVEDIPAALRSNFARATPMLTQEEKDDVITEGRVVFELCAELVQFLDEKVPAVMALLESDKQKALESNGNQESVLALVWLQISSLLSPVWRLIVGILASIGLLDKPRQAEKESHTD